MKLFAIVLNLSLLIISGCGVDEEASDPDFTTGAGPLRGHEDLTRFAVQWANEHSNVELFPEVSESSAGYDSNHPMIKGNYQSDFPSNEVRNFNNASPSDDWHNAGHLQNIHALSNHNGTSVESNQATCLGMQRQVTRATELAYDYYIKGKNDKAFFWLGHGMHTIQDSFSRAHTERYNAGERTVRKFCTYGLELVDGCYHSAVSHNDRVWKGTVSCQVNPFEREADCLKTEAFQAAKASAGYLMTFEKLINHRSLNLRNELKDYFEMPGEFTGFLTCQNLGSLPSAVVNIKYLVSSTPNFSCGGNYLNTGVDLNKGAGGSFINMCVGKGRERTPINDLRVIYGKGSSCPSGYGKHGVDLNKGAGGEYIYLCESRGANNPIQDIRIIASSKSSTSCPGGFTKIAKDLNKGAGGKYIYLCYRK